MALINIGNLYCLTNIECAVVGCFLAHDETEQCGFAGAVGADYADNAVWWQRETKVVEQLFLAECLGQIRRFDNLVAQTWTVWDEYLKFFFTCFLILVEQTVVAVQTCLAFCLTCFRGHAHPLQLAFKSLAALTGLFLFLGHAFGFLVEPRRIVAFPWNTLTSLLELLRHPDFTDATREALAIELLEREQDRYDSIVKLSELLARLAPMLGLLGTLIPLGPGIIALGQGDTYTLSTSLLTAFDTTIAGLVAAALAIVVSAIRRRWYREYGSVLEALCTEVLELTKKGEAR